jgi:hypothetical protein
MNKEVFPVLLLLCLLFVGFAEVDLSFKNSNYKGYNFTLFKEDFGRNYDPQEE